MADDPRTPFGQGWGFDAETLASLRLQRARAAVAAGDPGTALVEVEELLDTQPDEVAALDIAGHAALALGDAATAAVALDGLVRRRPERADAWALLARARLESADIPGALQAADRALELPPADDLSTARACFVRGLVRSRRGRPGAQADLDRAAALAPRDYPVPQELDDRSWVEALRLARGHLPQAVAAFLDGVQVVIQRHPAIEDLLAARPRGSALAGAIARGPPPLEDAWAERPSSVVLYRDNLGWPSAPDVVVADRIVTALTDLASTWTGEELSEEEDLSEEDLDEPTAPS